DDLTHSTFLSCQRFLSACFLQNPLLLCSDSSFERCAVAGGRQSFMRAVPVQPGNARYDHFRPGARKISLSHNWCRWMGVQCVRAQYLPATIVYSLFPIN